MELGSTDALIRHSISNPKWKKFKKNLYGRTGETLVKWSYLTLEFHARKEPNS